MFDSLPRTARIAVALALLAATVSACGSPVPGSEKLDSHIDEYVDIAGLNDPVSRYFFSVEFPVSQPPDGYVSGMIVAVDPQKRKLDDRLQRALPADLLAVEPDDVGTIVWVKWGESHVGTYHVGGNPKGSGEAYQGYCTVVVIDKAAAVIVGGKAFKAPAPPETTTEKGDIHTEVDVTVVVAYLKSLPATPTAPTPTLPASQ